jgi:hypothetical protein
MLSRHVVHFGNLKMNANKGVQSSSSILKLDKSLSHLRNLRANLNITKMQNLYKCTEGVVNEDKANNDLCKYIYEVYFISF